MPPLTHIAFESALAPEALRALVLENASREIHSPKPFFLAGDEDGVLDLMVRHLAANFQYSQAKVRFTPANGGSLVEVEVLPRPHDRQLFFMITMMALMTLAVAVMLLNTHGQAVSMTLKSFTSLLVFAAPALFTMVMFHAALRRIVEGPGSLLAVMAALADGVVPEPGQEPKGRRAVMLAAILPSFLLAAVPVALAPVALVVPPYPAGDGSALVPTAAEVTGNEHAVHLDRQLDAAIQQGRDLRAKGDLAGAVDAYLVAFATTDKLLPCGYPCTYYAVDGQARILADLAGPKADLGKLPPEAVARLLAAREQAAQARPSLREAMAQDVRTQLMRALHDLGPAAARDAVRRRAADLAVQPIMARLPALQAGDLVTAARQPALGASPREFFGSVSGMVVGLQAAVLGLAHLEAGEPLARSAATSAVEAVALYGPEDVIRFETYQAREAAFTRLLRDRLGRPSTPVPDPFDPRRALHLAGGEGWSVGIDGKDDGGKPYDFGNRSQRHWESGSCASGWGDLHGDLPLLHGGKLVL